MQVQSVGQQDPLEEGMATHCSILSWRIPWTEEPGGPCKESDMTEVTQHTHSTSFSSTSLIQCKSLMRRECDQKSPYLLSLPQDHQ